MSKSIVLYAAETRLTNDHQPVMTSDGTTIFIRASVVEGDWSKALDTLNASTNETVLNAIPHPRHP